MGRITIDLLRKRSEHNEGMLSNLEELALHQQHIEKIELLNRACRHLKILLLQNNLIHKFQNLHRMKDLQYLNVALNNITKIQNLQFCESLTKLDMTMNFVPKQGLLSVHSLLANPALEELYLLGNPCADWPNYRAYVIAVLPDLKRLDGHDVKPSERISALQRKDLMHRCLCDQLVQAGVSVSDAQAVENDGLEYDSSEEVVDPGYVDPVDGTFKRPWCPATRILEHRENEQIEREQEEGRKQATKPAYKEPQVPRWKGFPCISDETTTKQRNEGGWGFTLDVTDDFSCIELAVSIGKHLDSTLVQADVQPRWVRLLIKGRLLQLRLPCEVHADRSHAKRSKATGTLVMTMPRTDPASRHLDVTCMRPKQTREQSAQEPESSHVLEAAHKFVHAPMESYKFQMKELAHASVCECNEENGTPPPLC
eukprot:jgi/Ulvmu1/4403/UM002_0128.1